VTDESTADDGALFAFWAFITDVVDNDRPEPFDPAHLERPSEFRVAVDVFDHLPVDP
jgi:hypothetical protein